jgi:hypothetical protein
VGWKLIKYLNISQKCIEIKDGGGTSLMLHKYKQFISEVPHIHPEIFYKERHGKRGS